MRFYSILILTFLSHYVSGQFGKIKHDSRYVTVREGAHMFYWLFYTVADVRKYTDRPLVVWLQGGPGSSSTGLGNFNLIGPYDSTLRKRDHTWLKKFNILFVDNPVGAGFSYVDHTRYLANTNNVALDFVKLMISFYNSHPEFERVPLYIYGQSYGAKMAVDIALGMHEAEVAGRIRSNLTGIGLCNGWISPLDNIQQMAPLLLAFGLVDKEGHDVIEAQVNKTAYLIRNRRFIDSSNQWAVTQQTVLSRTTSLDFNNVHTKMREPYFVQKSKDNAYEFARDTLLRNALPVAWETTQEYSLNKFMNKEIKKYLSIPEHVTWGSQSLSVFNRLKYSFMEPVTDGIETLLNDTNIILTIFNGNLDLICNTAGQLIWVDRLKWPGAKTYRKAKRTPIYENNWLEGYNKSYGRFRFFWINNAGHNVPIENPAGTNAVLRDMLKY